MAEATKKSVTTTTTARDDSPTASKTAAQAALRFERFFSKAGVSPYDEVQWERRTALITDASGKTIFEQKDVEVPDRLVDDGDQHRGQQVPARTDRHAGARDRRPPAGRPRGRDDPRLGHGRRLLRHPRRRRHLPRRAGAPAADAEGRLQLAGLVQRGLRPAGAEFRRAELALEPAHLRRRVLRHRLPQSAVLGLLHQRRRRLARLHPDPGQDRRHALQVGLGHGHQPFAPCADRWNCSRAAAQPPARSASCADSTPLPASSSPAARRAAPPRWSSSTSTIRTSSTSSSARRRKRPRPGR